MNATNTILMGLLGRALFGKAFSFEEKETDWQALYKEAKAQTVHLLIYDCLTKAEQAAMPTDVATQWRMLAFRTLSKTEKLYKEQKKILHLLADKKIDCCILKGSSCAINYPKPELRSAGDIDLLLSREDLKAAEALLRCVGYTSAEGEHPCHIAMHCGDWETELHFEPSGFPSGEIGEQIRHYFCDAEKQAVEQQGLPILPPCHSAIVLLTHKLNHLVGSGLGLRQICDWAVFVHKQVNHNVWRELEPLLQQFGILHFTKIITRLCVEYLGLPQNVAPWCMDADIHVTHELLEDILKTGNFGRKEKRYGQRLFTDGGSGGRLASFWRVGLRVCRNSWPICKKYPVLLIFAPFVVARRYLKRRKQGKRPELRLRAMYKEAEQRQALYHELHVFQ